VSIKSFASFCIIGAAANMRKWKITSFIILRGYHFQLRKFHQRRAGKVQVKYFKGERRLE
jgi:hypothetical protein